MKNDTVLGCIMDILDITGKELAAELGTDTTTVSKWRTKKRKLSYQSDYSRKMAEWFLGDTFAECREPLLEFLEEMYEGFSGLNPAEQEEKLRWLLCKSDSYILVSGGNQNAQEYSTRIQIFLPDEKGWEKAIRFLDEKLQKQKKCKRLILCDFGNIDWSSCSREILEGQIQWLKRLCAQGYEIVIIDVAGKDYRSPNVLFRWFSVYMRQGIEVYYVLDTLPGLQHGCNYIAENVGALEGFFEGGDNKSGAYVYFEDEHMRQYFEGQADYYMHNAKKMLERIEINDNLQMVTLLNQNLSGAEITYMINPSPTYINMSEGLLRTVLQRNGVEEELINTCIEVNQKRHKIRKRCKYVQLYDIDEIEDRLAGDESKMDLLSIVAGRKITMLRREFVRQLEEIVQFLERQEMEIILVSFRELGIGKQNVSLTVQENRLFIAWDDKVYNTMLYSKEPTFIGGMVLYVKNLLVQVHPLHRNREWTISQLQKYIEQYKSL